MTIDTIRAAQAYADIAKVAAEAPRPEASEAAGSANFQEMVKSAIDGTAQSLKAGETAVAQVATGEAGLVDVVTAVSAAEVTLETAIAVRNRVIEAYQEILRMPI